MASLMSQELFLAGLKHCVENPPPDAEEYLTNTALRLLLITGALDGDVDRVVYALDNGAKANEGLTAIDYEMLTTLGWEIPDLPSPGSPDASYESSSQSQSSEEAYPNG
jgi:hypothetical protein